MFRRKITRFQGVSGPALSSDVEGVPELSSSRRNLVRAGRIAGNPIFVLGIFLVAYAALGFMYYTASSAKEEHESAFDAAQASLAAQPDDPNALRSALDGWTAALKAADQMRVEAKFDSALLAQIMVVAEEASATLVSAGLQSDGLEVINENEYLATPIRLRVKGSLAVIQDFVSRLEEGAIEALEVQNSQVTLDTTDYSAIVNVAVFSQPGGLREVEE